IATNRTVSDYRVPQQRSAISSTTTVAIADGRVGIALLAGRPAQPALHRRRDTHLPAAVLGVFKRESADVLHEVVEFQGLRAMIDRSNATLCIDEQHVFSVERRTIFWNESVRR